MSGEGATVQCLLGKNSRYQVAWIGEGVARVGNIVEIVHNERVDPGWRVISADDRPGDGYLTEAIEDRALATSEC